MRASSRKNRSALYAAALLDYQSPLRNFGEILAIGGLEPAACHAPSHQRVLHGLGCHGLAQVAFFDDAFVGPWSSPTAPPARPRPCAGPWRACNWPTSCAAMKPTACTMQATSSPSRCCSASGRNRNGCSGQFCILC